MLILVAARAIRTADIFAGIIVCLFAITVFPSLNKLFEVLTISKDLPGLPSRDRGVIEAKLSQDGGAVFADGRNRAHGRFDALHANRRHEGGKTSGRRLHLAPGVAGGELRM